MCNTYMTLPNILSMHIGFCCFLLSGIRASKTKSVTNAKIPSYLRWNEEGANFAINSGRGLYTAPDPGTFVPRSNVFTKFTPSLPGPI